MDEIRVPIYLITGFLESGKTTFLNFTLNQDYFEIEGKTLLILCEEGEEEYDLEALKQRNTVVEIIEKEEDFTTERLTAMASTLCLIFLLSNGIELLKKKYSQLERAFADTPFGINFKYPLAVFALLNVSTPAILRSSMRLSPTVIKCSTFLCLSRDFFSDAFSFSCWFNVADNAKPMPVCTNLPDINPFTKFFLSSEEIKGSSSSSPSSSSN